MTVLSYAQLKAAWLDGSQGTRYHTNSWASLMAAIAEAESRGNTEAINPNDDNGAQTSWGLWQISNGTHSEVSPNWTDPAEQVILAIQKLNSPTGLSAWGTYDSGAYKAFYSGKTAPDTSGVGTGPTSAVDTAALEQQAQAATQAAKTSKDCLWGIGALTVPVIPGVYSQTISSGWCIISRSEARAIIGSVFLIGGGILMLGGFGLISVLAGMKGGERLAQTLGPALKYAAAAAA